VIGVSSSRTGCGRSRRVNGLRGVKRTGGNSIAPIRCADVKEIVSLVSCGDQDEDEDDEDEDEEEEEEPVWTSPERTASKKCFDE
jgi:hypothetical protein